MSQIPNQVPQVASPTVKAIATPLKEIIKPYKLIIKKEVQDKIDLICAKIHAVEWSGTLFYTVEGSLAENNLVVHVQDLFVMDIGTSGYTEYHESPDIISYMLEKDLLDTHMGLVHSHNNMETFFSGTDLNTLREESSQHNHFVSLIVNNRRKYTAAITTVLKTVSTISEEFKYESFNGEIVTGVDTHTSETEEIIYSKMEVIIEITNYENQEILDRLNLIEEEKRNRVPVRPAYNHPAIVNTGGGVAIQNQVQRMYTPISNPNYQQEKSWGEQDFNAWHRQNPPAKESLQKDNIPGYFPKQKEIEFEKASMEKGTLEIPYDQVSIDADLALLLAKKLVTGSILVPKNNKIDLGTFINSMPSQYKDIFDIVAYDFFISGMVEAIIFNVEDDMLGGFDDDEMAAIAAFSIQAILSQYPSNPYLDILISNLQNYII